jgi:hypothetical protein
VTARWKGDAPSLAIALSRVTSAIGGAYWRVNTAWIVMVLCSDAMRSGL